MVACPEVTSRGGPIPVGSRETGPATVVRRVVVTCVVVTALGKMGATPVGNSPKDFDAFMRAEAVKWEPVLKEANIKMQ